MKILKMEESVKSFVHASDTELQIRELARTFAHKQILPHVAADEAQERFRPEWIEAMGALGLTGVSIPEVYGGAGLGTLETTAVIEELAAVSSSYAISVAVTGLPSRIILEFGSEAQKQRWVPRLAQGKAIGSFSLSEPGSGSDAASLRTTAKRVGDHYVLNGTKLWVTQADVADVILVFARTADAATHGAKGISAFLVPRDTPGLGMGKREHKIALHASHTMEIHFQNAKIPMDARVGDEGQGFAIAMAALDAGRISIAANALGVARAALRVAHQHASLREQFGKPVLEFQGVSFLLADGRTQWEAARLLTRQAAWLKDHHLPYSTEAAMAKLFATDMAMRVTTDCVQVLGGSGLTQEFPVERYMREAKVLQIVEGTNQVQRVVIAKKGDFGFELGQSSH